MGTRDEQLMCMLKKEQHSMEYCSISGYKGDSRWFSRDGHFYVASRSRGASTVMRCASDKCPARWLLKNGQAGPVVNSHDHEPTPWVPNRNAMFQTLKQRAASENIPINKIYEEEAARYPDAAPHLVWESVAPSMRKWRRRQQLPAVPGTLVRASNNSDGTGRKYSPCLWYSKTNVLQPQTPPVDGPDSDTSINRTEFVFFDDCEEDNTEYVEMPVEYLEDMEDHSDSSGEPPGCLRHQVKQEPADPMLVASRDWEVIGQAIGVQLRDVAPHQAAIAQKLIADTLFRAKLGRLTEHSAIS